MEQTLIAPLVYKPLLVGMKIPVKLITELFSLDKIISWFKIYHNENYVLGCDRIYCDEPHYHLHFITDGNKFQENSIKSQKSTKLKAIKDLGADTGGRLTTLYFGKKIEGSDPLVWLAYALKEEIIYCPEIYKTPQFEGLRLAQLEVKKMSHIYRQKEDNKRLVKKELKDNVFDAIKGELKTDPTFDSVRIAILAVLAKMENFSHMRKNILDLWAMEYLYKNSLATPTDLFNFIYLRN